MEYLLLTVIGILLLVVFALSAKIYFLHKSTQEIVDDFRNRLTADTNVLIDISSHDPYMRKLAVEINIQLRLLRKERRRYQQGDLELKEAVTNISHDLRTPLTAICGYLALLEKEDVSPEVRRYLDIISERAQTLKILTEELFRYSVIIVSEELTMEEIDLVRAIEEAVAASYATLKEAGIEPDIHLPDDPVMRMLDRAAVKRVFGNILSNVAKYSAGDLLINLSPEGAITFTNTAPSLDHVQVGRLFDRFYTVDSAVRSTGLGLSIAKTLVEQMKGEISAQYNDGKLSICTNFKNTAL